MERIKNILGLWVFEKRITDIFERTFLASIRRAGGKMANFAGDISLKEEMGALEKETKNLDGKKDRAYGQALRLLTKIKPEYKRYLPKKGKGRKAPELSDLLKKKMRLAIWVGVGYKIPDRDLVELFVKNLLKEKGYAYRRKKGQMGWYRKGLLVGGNLFEALEHLEKFETVDRSRLTVSF